jgi:Na+-translocating ferredoxin:NAD+ oxidoreductase subunit A
MEFKVITGILLSAIIINNYVLSKRNGVRFFLKLNSVWGMGVAVTLLMSLSSFITYYLYTYLLSSFQMELLRTAACVITAAFLSLIVKIIINRIFPSPDNKNGVFFSLAALNCSLLAVTLLYVDFGFAIVDAGPVEPTLQGFCGGIGFAITLLLVAGIRERLELAFLPEKLKGLPITVIAVGIMALAFFGFAGMKIIIKQ